MTGSRRPFLLARPKALASLFQTNDGEVATSQSLVPYMFLSTWNSRKSFYTDHFLYDRRACI